MGSQSLSAHIGHDMERGHPLPKDGKDIRSHVLDRAKIFLRDQDSSRRSDVDPAKWHEDEKFTVKYCESLRISKHLNWKHSEHGCRDDTACQEAYAGLESTNDGNYVLWIRDKGPEAKHDWYEWVVGRSSVEDQCLTISVSAYLSLSVAFFSGFTRHMTRCYS